ncbi:MAG: ATP-binding protein, partial [Chloroflexi bacterium]|nr:ATP-binding protein [Chloroflexota bacterium]
MRSGSVFVGRYRELTLLREGLGQLAHGSPMITSVVGEAGIGKTALVSQAIDSAAGLGIRVARSSAVEGGGSPAYWLWKDVLRQLSIGDQIDFD